MFKEEGGPTLQEQISLQWLPHPLRNPKNIAMLKRSRKFWKEKFKNLLNFA